jgi:leucyl aminopeptidase
MKKNKENSGKDDEQTVQPSTQSVTTINIDPLLPFISIRMAAKSLPKNKNICLCITSLPKKYKFVFLTYASKMLYSFDKYISSNKNNKSTEIYIFDKKSINKEIQCFVCSLNCADVARDMENEPANVMSPDAFVKYTEHVLKGVVSNSLKTQSKPSLNIKVLDHDDMKKEGLNLVLAIGMSSVRKPKFMIIESIHNINKYPTICLIGKTVLFDSGGLNIKTRAMLPEMKTDKTGGAVTVAIIRYFLMNNIKVNIIGALPIVENLLGEHVTRPGDIVKSHSGKTVEISDVDAEGRLILADALSYLTSYCKKYNPTYIVDFATLTGWSESVHLDLTAVCYCKDMKIAAKINDVGEYVGERVWFLPPWDEYTFFTKSTVANTRNYNLNVKEGAYLPAMFMMNFVPENMREKWVHFDICNNFQGDLARGNCVTLATKWLHTLTSSK